MKKVIISWLVLLHIPLTASTALAQNDAQLVNNVDTGTVEDINGNVYRTIKIGDQWWMAENLKVTMYRNGDAIPNVTDTSVWSGLSTGARCVYNNDEGNASTYGYLYNWYAAVNINGLAPQGWHVPTDADWKELERYLGMSQSEVDGTAWRSSDVGGKLKEKGTSHWNSPNTGATNESGFAALPGGFRFFNGVFHSIGLGVGFWSSTECDTNTAWNRAPYYRNSSVYRYNYPKKRGFSVRCVKDKETI